jgi:PBP1b-binding outer membrane lipoprotein LpoB
MDVVRQIEGSQNPVFNQAKIPQYGKQLGVKYYVTGKVGASDERTDDQRRVQYLLYMQVIEVETGAIRWQQKAEITKMVR